MIPKRFHQRSSVLKRFLHVNEIAGQLQRDFGVTAPHGFTHPGPRNTIAEWIKVGTNVVGLVVFASFKNKVYVGWSCLHPDDQADFCKGSPAYLVHREIAFTRLLRNIRRNKRSFSVPQAIFNQLTEKGRWNRKDVQGCVIDRIRYYFKGCQLPTILNQNERKTAKASLANVVVSPAIVRIPAQESSILTIKRIAPAESAHTDPELQFGSNC